MALVASVLLLHLALEQAISRRFWRPFSLNMARNMSLNERAAVAISLYMCLEEEPQKKGKHGPPAARSQGHTISWFTS